MILVHGSRNCNNMKFCLLQIRFVRSKCYARLFDSFIPDFICRIFAVLIQFNLCFIEIKAYYFYTFICESNSDWHTNIAKTNKRNRFLTRFNFVA